MKGKIQANEEKSIAQIRMKEKNKRKEYGRELKTEKEGSKTRKRGKVKMKC